MEEREGGVLGTVLMLITSREGSWLFWVLYYIIEENCSCRGCESSRYEKLVL